MENQAATPPVLGKLTIEYDGVNFRSQVDGELPVIPLIGIMMTQVLQFSAKQIAENQQREILKARNAAAGGKLFYPDGTPYSH